VCIYSDTPSLHLGSICFYRDNTKYLYVVLLGEILLYRKENGSIKPLDLVSPGEVFGEMSLITEDVRFSTARASEESDLFVMSKEELFYGQHEGSLPPSILVVQALVRRLHLFNEREAKLKWNKSNNN
jgi:CRP-like cAMP-binding protein